MEIKRRDYASVEMQMGPMIDMVFLLLVFFMVTAKPIKQESDVGLQLPGTVSQEESVDIPDEQNIVIQENGQVVLNDQLLGAPDDHALTGLVGTLKRFRETAKANKSKALVTIDPADQAVHQRIVDVLNACAKAEITGVTFSDSTAGDAEGTF